MSKPPRPPLTLAQQLLHLRRNPICNGVGDVAGGRLVWCFEARPTALSRSYSIRLEMVPGKPPTVTVESPDLNGLAGEHPIPHVYSQDPVTLCLYLPNTGEWRPSLRLDMTVVPWVYLWLYFFEDWLITKEWAGGGVHPEAGTQPRRYRADRADRGMVGRFQAGGER